MLLTGQPLHAFDLDLVPTGSTHRPQCDPWSKVTTLDGIGESSRPAWSWSATANGPAAIAGIMGGSVSEVSDSTTSVLLEAATWNGPNILKSSRDLNLRSEASARFEKQLHPALAERAQAIASRLLVELAGEAAVEGMVDVADELPDAGPIRLRAGRVERILGMAIDRAEQAAALERLGFGVAEDGDDLLVTVPPDRHFDVTREIDLVEESAGSTTSTGVPATLPSRSAGVGGLSRQQMLQRRAEDSLREQASTRSSAGASPTLQKLAIAPFCAGSEGAAGQALEPAFGRPVR